MSDEITKTIWPLNHPPPIAESLIAEDAPCENIPIKVERKSKLSIYHEDNEYFKKVEQDATEAHQSDDLHNEIKLLRASTLELLKKFRKGEALKGYKRGNGGPVEPVFVSDIEMVKAICQLTKTISSLTKNDHDINKENFISRNNFRIWLSNLAREIKLTFPAEVDQKKFSQIARKVGEPAGES